MNTKTTVLIIGLLLSLAPTLIRHAASAETPLVYLDPSLISGVGEGENFVVTVRINAFQGLYAWTINVSWDPAVVSFVGATEGNCLKSNGSTLFLTGTVSTGSIKGMMCTLLGNPSVYFVNVPPASDDFVSLEFQVVQCVSESVITVECKLKDKFAADHFPDVQAATIKWQADGQLVVRGLNNRIYYRTYNITSSSWNSWNALPTGLTCDSPAATICCGKLHVVVRGFSSVDALGNCSIWYGWINLTDNNFVGWTRLAGATSSAPSLTSNGSTLILSVKGMNNRIYYKIYDCELETWSGWDAVPTGSTCDSPAAVLLGKELHIVVRGMDELSLWHGAFEPAVPGSFVGWTRLAGATSSAPSLTS